jgi:hypothetical protein
VSGDNTVKRGSSANFDGFVFEVICGRYTDAFTAGSGAFIGLTQSHVGVGEGAFPTSGNNCIGIGWTTTDTGTSKLAIISANGTAANTSVRTASNDGELQDFNAFYIRITCEPNSSEIIIYAKNLETGTVVFNNVSHTGAIPTTTAYLYPHISVGTGTTSTAQTIRIAAASSRPKLRILGT